MIGSLGDDADFRDDRLDIFKKRKGWVLQGRYECFTNTATGFKTGVEGWYGIRTPTNIAQTVDLYLKPKGKDESQWKLYGSQPVTSYGFTALPAFNLRLPGAWDMRLRTGTKSTADVVVDDIVQYILHDLHSGASLNQTIGAYDNVTRKEIITIVDKQEYRKLMDYIHRADPKAFVTVYSVNEIRYQPKK